MNAESSEQTGHAGLPLPEDEEELKRRVTQNGEFCIAVELWIRNDTEYHVLPDLDGEQSKQIALAERDDSIEMRTFDRSQFTPDAEKEGEIEVADSLFAELLEVDAE